MINIKKYYKSLVTGKEYEKEVYANHGWGGLKCSFVPGEGTICREDLPHDEYPYTVIEKPLERNIII